MEEGPCLEIFSSTRSDGAVLLKIEFDQEKFKDMASAERKRAAVALMRAAAVLVEAS